MVKTMFNPNANGCKRYRIGIQSLKYYQDTRTCLAACHRFRVGFFNLFSLLRSGRQKRLASHIDWI